MSVRRHHHGSSTTSTSFTCRLLCTAPQRGGITRVPRGPYHQAATCKLGTRAPTKGDSLPSLKKGRGGHSHAAASQGQAPPPIGTLCSSFFT